MKSYYLTQIKLNDSRRSTWNLLGELEPLHALVMKMFPNDPGRILWRLDKNYEGPVLYILSADIPDATGVVEQFGWPRLDYQQQVRTVDLTKFFESIREGDRYGFRIAINPVRNNGRTGKNTLIVGKRALDLVRDRLDANGFHVEEVRQADEAHNLLCKNGHKTVRVITSFEGILSVTDPEKAVQTLVNGVGRMKAYGAGLLTLARI